MSYPVSACCFIRNTFQGAFCIFESLASLLPFVSEFIILDLESDDGTWEILTEIEDANSKVHLYRQPWPKIDAGVFADLANDLIAKCRFDNILYFQADEIWHQDLLEMMEEKFQQGRFDLTFWRIQYRDNFQRVKWFPHPVHRVGHKSNFNFIGDGMSTDRTFEAEICSTYDGGWFTKWGEMRPLTLPVHEMITDVSLVGGFRDNIIERRLMHAPFWREEPHIEGQPASQWQQDALANPDWTRPMSPFNLPQILKYHVGKTRYRLRPELLEAIKANNTREIIGL